MGSLLCPGAAGTLGLRTLPLPPPPPPGGGGGVITCGGERGDTNPSLSGLFPLPYLAEGVATLCVLCCGLGTDANADLNSHLCEE